MDTVSVAKRRDGLREKLDAALGTMHRAASAAVLKGDPLAEQLQALAASIDALAEIYEASADTQLDIADTLRTQADVVATEAVRYTLPASPLSTSSRRGSPASWKKRPGSG